MLLELVTPLILTYNEAPNIERTLAKLDWARQIIIIDSGSNDGTLNIASRHANVRAIQRPFDQHARQWNFGLDQVVSPWVLSLDADYVIDAKLVDEIADLAESQKIAFRAGFRYRVFGKRLRGALYPHRIVLFRKDSCRYVQEGHTQKLSVQGKIGDLNARIDHDDRKPLSRWLESQRLYARLEADHLLAMNKTELSWPDRLRRHIWPAAPAAFLYTLLVKQCLFDGWPGWYYALQRTYAEALLSLELLDRRLRGVNHCS